MIGLIALEVTRSEEIQHRLSTALKLSLHLCKMVVTSVTFSAVQTVVFEISLADLGLPLQEPWEDM